MDNSEKLRNLVLAPYIMKAMALIGKERKVGGNQFRHSIMTMGILLDYKIFDYVLLKAAVIHDLLEDVPETDESGLRCIDEEANEVVDLVKEVTRANCVKKEDYLKQILESGSWNAKVLKVADRISNLTDLHRDDYSRRKMAGYLDQTEKYILPMAEQVNPNMAIELSDLISRRRKMLNMIQIPLMQKRQKK